MRRNKTRRRRSSRRSKRLVSRGAHWGWASKTRKRKRKASGYARFVKTMWAKHRARYKRMAFKAVSKEISREYRKKGC